MNDTSTAEPKNLHYGPDEPTCNDGTIRHSWDQQRQHDQDIFADTTTKAIGSAHPPLSKRDYTFREYHCEKCGARKQVSTEVRTSYATLV